jgi:transposase-like protein
MVNIQALIDDAKCFETIRAMRWPDGVRCPGCGCAEVTRDGHDDTQPERQRYRCHGCYKRFDDLTDTIFAGHHQPLRAWVLCLYFMGLNLSNEQIAQELGIDPDDAQVMASRLREGIVQRQPEVQLSGEVECDEVYAVAGHKGHPLAVRKKGDSAAAAGRRGRRAGGRCPRRSRRSSG